MMEHSCLGEFFYNHIWNKMAQPDLMAIYNFNIVKSLHVFVQILNWIVRL